MHNMADQINLTVAKNLTAESLNLLLARFSADKRESAIVYTDLRDSLIRFFQLKGDAEPESAADETLDRTAAKIAAETPIIDVKKYCFGVARLIFLERTRLAHREKNAAEEFFKAGDSLTANSETNEFDFFRECFDSLPAADRNFLQNYFADLPYAELIESRRRLMGETGISLEQMRVKIFRLRKNLEKCVRLRRENN